MARVGTAVEENEHYSFAASLAASAAVVLQAASGVVFVVRVHVLTEEFKEEIAFGDKDPQEEEVKAAVKADEEANQRYEARTGRVAAPYLALPFRLCIYWAWIGVVCLCMIGVRSLRAAAQNLARRLCASK